MSGVHVLPADVGQWPSDPYDLLGVSARSTPDEVRAAHDRLAAAFDPARAPEQRRRLREARDKVLGDLDLLSLLDMPPTLDIQPDPHLAPRPAAPPNDDFDLSEALRAAVPPPLPAASSDAIATTPLPLARNEAIGLWQMALAGREAEAYHGLADLAAVGGAGEDTYARLYWLLTARPDLDRERSPLGWLATGLRAVGLSGVPWELYRRALARDPDEPLSPRCARLFGAPAEPAALVELAGFRWQAAARAQRWDVISSDLQVLRERLPASERMAWAQVWSAALDQLAWSDAKEARELATRCFQWLGEVYSDAPQVTEVRKRQNILRDLAAGWRALRPDPDVPPPLLALIPPSWSRPFLDMRPQLLAYLADVLRSPRPFLRALDAAHERPSVLKQFGRLLERLEKTLPPAPLEARSSSDLAELVFAFLDTSDRSYYRNFRPPLLDFCLREAVSPEMVAELTAEHPSYWLTPDRHLSEAVRADEPLRLACLAHQLFWA